LKVLVRKILKLVIASAAKQSTDANKSTTCGLPRRYAPRNDEIQQPTKKQPVLWFLGRQTCLSSYIFDTKMQATT